jgi:pimeloyl-ACP methyl ester carboxylesterase
MKTRRIHQRGDTMSPDHSKGWIALSGLAALAAAAAGFWRWPVSYYEGLTGAWTWLRGFRSYWADVNGYRIHYLAGGPAAGSPVILLHGLGGRAQDWRALAPFFVRAGFRVYMPDLLGYGRSPQPRDFSYSMRDQAALIIAFIRALGLRSVDLGGWSMGGWIAQLVAARLPQLVRHLMLFNSAGLHVRPQWTPQIFTPTTPAQVQRLNAMMNPKPLPLPGFVARGLIRESLVNAWVIRRALAAMFRGRDVTNKILPTLRMPVFIGWGAHDQCIPVGQAELMRRLIPGAKLHIVPDSGHLAPLFSADKIGPEAVAFLKSTPAQHQQSAQTAA